MDTQTEPSAPALGASASWRGVAVYLALAFGLSWAAQVVVALLSPSGTLTAISRSGGILVVAVFLMWPPAVGAYVARRWVEHGNLADAGLRWCPWRYVLLAWFGPAVLTLASLLLSLPLYPLDSDFTTLRQMAAQAGQTLPVPPEVVVLVQVLSGLTVAVLINSVFAFGEEFGWRGYLLPRLMQLLGPWPGLLAHGAIWGFWHAPLIFLIGYNYPGHNLLGVPWFVIAAMLLGVLFGWLRLASRSIVPPTIAHASFNAIAGLPLILLRGVDPAVGGVLYSPVGWIVMLIVIWLLTRTGALDRALTPQYTRSLPSSAAAPAHP